MKPDGLKMFMSDLSVTTPEQIFEFDILPVVPPLIDIREVSTDFPNGGIKSFKLHAKFTGDGGSASMSTSVIGKRLATLPNPDGGELLIPYKFTAKARSEIMSTLGTDRAKGGVFVRYELVQGSPFDTAVPNDGLAILMFRSTTTPASLPVNAFNDITSTFTILNHNTGLPLETDEPEGSYFTAKANLRDIFHADGVFNNRGWDFESHVKSISIGYWIDTFASPSSFNDVEALMYGDEINLLPETTETFDVNAILFTDPLKEKEFFVNKFVKAVDQEKEFFVNTFIQTLDKEKEFFINSVIGDPFKEKEFFMGAKVVIRTAVNSLIASAFLKAFDQEEEFFVNAILTKVGVNAKLPLLNAILQAFDQEEEFFINAILQPTATIIIAPFFINAILVIQGVNQVEFFIDARVGAVVNEETFIIGAQIGLSEPQSILDVESVIGHKTGIQS